VLNIEIPYPENGQIAELFAPIAQTPWSVWLDSGSTPSDTRRFDIIVADPVVTVVTRGSETILTHRNGKTRNTAGDPFDVLRETLSGFHDASVEGVPFAGGAVGYFSYDLARRFETIPELADDDLAMPEMVVGIYEWALVCDHLQHVCRLVSTQLDAESREWQRLVAIFTEQKTSHDPGTCMKAKGGAVSNLSAEAYTTAFEHIQHYLEEGDCYQVNFAQRFSLGVAGSAWSGYCELRQRSSGPFSAFLNTPFGEILCTSPERFLQVRNGCVETRPIKGTRRREPDPVTDARLRQELVDSSKDRAENLMIVDLLRNDLGKSCKTGSIQVPQLFNVESFSTVHHLVSTVIGELDDNEDALSLLRGCFPGGSITGAPKLRAMAIIEELEPHRRGVYCGSIGYIGFDGNMDSNIVIRTAIHRGGKLYYSAGGGIVRDSVCEEEYQESFDKAKAFLECFSRLD